MQLSIAVLCAILTGPIFSVSASLRANEDPFVISMRQDTSLSDYERKSEEKYFAISAILDEGVDKEFLIDSIGPYAKGLSLEFRERIYKERKRLVLHTTTGSGSLGFILFVPVVVSIIQGDGVGIGLGLAGMGSLVGLSATSYNNTSSSIRGALGIMGVGCLIATTIRAASVNDSNDSYNTALSYALVIPKDFSCTVYPDVRSLHDGTIVPALTFSLKLD